MVPHWETVRTARQAANHKRAPTGRICTLRRMSLPTTLAGIDPARIHSGAQARFGIIAQ
ncbi:hypothetical protein ACCQ14_03770 [Xanthomonas sp. NCPPB 2865]|uniref:hypothetical protein n=1 Tax=Xanthomonas TaxID=338 RepID=UPI0015E2AA5C|nr:hypothetical protein [Xanthomonas arboricola]MBB4708496.1 hypothetical protein [Xanthomonas arboricola]